jgi:type I restriction enzyme R subunit
MFRLAKQNMDEQDEEVDVSKAKRKLVKYVVLYPYNISQTIAVIVEHFREKVMHLLGGRAKAMVVTASREEAARYKLALDKYIQEQGYQDIKALVAFSGQLNVPDVSSGALTEYNMNPGLAGRSLEQAFEDEYQIMLVAEKFQTGFDQPLLCAMYVLKKLSGVAAVQTLGRLNRTYPGKKTFVIDFVNQADEIEEAFKTYYLRTSLLPSLKASRAMCLIRKPSKTRPEQTLLSSSNPGMCARRSWMQS